MATVGADDVGDGITWLLPRGAPPLVMVQPSGAEAATVGLVVLRVAVDPAGCAFGAAIYVPTGAANVCGGGGTGGSRRAQTRSLQGWARGWRVA